MKRARGLGIIYLRGRVWWVQYYARGTRHRESSQSANRADAVRLLKRRLADVASGRPVGPRIERTTLADLLDIVANDYRANGRRSLRRLDFAAAHLAAYFSPAARAIEITTDRLTAYQAHRLAMGAARASVNYELAILRRAFSLALRAGKVASRPDFPMLHVDNARQGFFEREHLEAVLKFLPGYLHPVIRTAFITGWRIHSELLTRQWRHVDFNHGWLRLDPGESKNREGREFPFTPELRSILEAQREYVRNLELAHNRLIAHVFVRPDGSPIRDFRAAWSSACTRAGLPGRIPHDLRRSAVRNLERAGVPRSAAMKITGHKTEAIYRRYAIVDERMMREAADKLANLHPARRIAQ